MHKQGFIAALAAGLAAMASFRERVTIDSKRVLDGLPGAPAFMVWNRGGHGGHSGSKQPSHIRVTEWRRRNREARAMRTSQRMAGKGKR